MMDFDVEFTSDEIDEYELAKLRVINLLDDDDWKWLAKRINKDKLTWVQIFDLVADHL